MHELSLSLSMMEIVEEEAIKQAFDKVKVLRLEIGMLSHVEPEAMAFSFESASKGTSAEGAKLEIIRVPGEAWCLMCEENVPLSDKYDPCPKCQGHNLKISNGDAMRIKELEVE